MLLTSRASPWRPCSVALEGVRPSVSRGHCRGGASAWGGPFLPSRVSESRTVGRGGLPPCHGRPAALIPAEVVCDQGPEAGGLAAPSRQGRRCLRSLRMVAEARGAERWLGPHVGGWSQQALRLLGGAGGRARQTRPGLSGTLSCDQDLLRPRSALGYRGAARLTQWVSATHLTPSPTHPEDVAGEPQALGDSGWSDSRLGDPYSPCGGNRGTVSEFSPSRAPTSPVWSWGAGPMASTGDPGRQKLLRRRELAL